MPVRCRFAAVLLCVFCGATLLGQEQATDFYFPFSASRGATPIDSTHGEKASLGGEYSYVPGVSGDAVHFDGYTTRMTVHLPEGQRAPRNGFTVEAWVALNTYPWNWVPVVDQELDGQEGYFFGIDAFGHFALEASFNGVWQKLVSKEVLPLKKWAHIAGSYETSADGQGTLRIFLNGTPSGEMDVHGVFTPAQADILIGRVREATLPFPEAVVKPQYPIWYSLDGILDEVGIYTRTLTRRRSQPASRQQKRHAVRCCRGRRCRRDRRGRGGLARCTRRCNTRTRGIG